MAAPTRTCRHCGRSLKGRRIDALYCSDAHRRRADRRRARGLPSDFAPDGWRRGRTGLGQRTELERRLENARKAAYREGHSVGQREGRRLALALLKMRLADRLIAQGAE